MQPDDSQVAYSSLAVPTFEITKNTDQKTTTASMPIKLVIKEVHFKRI